MLSSRIKSVIIVAVMCTGMAAITVQQDKLFEISKNLEIFISAYRELNANFVDELDPGTLMRTAIDAMTQSLDPYTNFTSESQVASYFISEDDRYQGIGARVGMVNDRLFFMEPYEGGPAVTAGIKAGDEIIAVEGQPVKGKKLEEISAMLRGIPGTAINLSIKANKTEQEKTVKLTRGEVNIPNVPYSGFVADDVGYIVLTTFTQQAGANIAKALKELKEKNPNMSGVILDLRQNGGGLLHEAVNICNLFLPEGEVVVTTRGKVKERDQIYKTLSRPLDLDIPLAVLIDKRSASASEIVSGVIQDMDRGVIIGQRSYGKGLVQNVRELPYNSRLKITISKYYIPSGRCIQGVEYENGEPKDIPDSQRSKFKTRNGRNVLDGGGITPDIRMDTPELLPVTQALLDQHLIFEYANIFCRNKDSIAAVGTFSFTDYDDFILFLKKKNFSYISEPEKHLAESGKALEKQIATGKADVSQKEALAQIEKLKQKLVLSKTAELETAKGQIIDEIEKEIITRYYFQRGKSQQTLDDDAEIKEAISVLRDTKRYKTILGIK
jgi:carboxyl-terminal processing protease